MSDNALSAMRALAFACVLQEKSEGKRIEKKVVKSHAKCVRKVYKKKYMHAK